MDFFDLTGDGNKEIIVGFDDGTIQVYAINSTNYHTDAPRLISSQSCHESISGLQGAIFGNMGFEEVLCVTYSGKTLVFCITLHFIINSTLWLQDGCLDSLPRQATSEFM